jgi:2-C-methyl-D-erythritol 4-phosphate cytidylyltransferase
MEKIAIIVAAGSGTRFNADLPKQFAMLAGLPLLMHTIKKFWNYDNSMRIIVVLSEKYIPFWKKLCKEYHFKVHHEIRKGGETRFQSVKNGLRGIKPGNLVAVHDGVRPLVSRQTIKRCFLIAEKKGTAIPVIDIAESVRLIDGNSSKVIVRDNLKLVQTPQVFQSELILKSYKKADGTSFTDDASVVESAGGKICIVEGNIENIKITNQKDLIVAKAFYSNTTQ